MGPNDNGGEKDAAGKEEAEMVKDEEILDESQDVEMASSAGGMEAEEVEPEVMLLMKRSPVYNGAPTLPSPRTWSNHSWIQMKICLLQTEPQRCAKRPLTRFFMKLLWMIGGN